MSVKVLFEVLKLLSVITIFTTCFHILSPAELTGNTNKSPVVAVCIRVLSIYTEISFVGVEDDVWNLRLNVLSS